VGDPGGRGERNGKINERGGRTMTACRARVDEILSLAGKALKKERKKGIKG